MKYTLPKSYSNAGIQVEIPESELRALRSTMGDTKSAIDKWLLDNDYMPRAEYDTIQAGAKPKTSAKREFKIDAEKAQIVTMLAAVLKDANDIDNVNIANPNRLISFSIGHGEGDSRADSKYELTLTRKKK